MKFSSSCEKLSSVFEDSCSDDKGSGNGKFELSWWYNIAKLSEMQKALKTWEGTIQDAPYADNRNMRILAFRLTFFVLLQNFSG